MKCWLLKTEPDEYSFQDLKKMVAFYGLGLLRY